MTDTITKREPKLSVVKRGYWRNRWTSLSGDPLECTHPDQKMCTALGDKTWLGHGRHVSAELAEQVALGPLRNPRWKMRGLRYLGPVFFPEGDDA